MYTGFARIYDKVMADVDYIGWAKFLDENIKAHAIIEGNNTLELCCGTGNLTLELIKLGYDMSGVDISLEMLSIASEKLKEESVILFQQDITRLSLNAKYRIILCPCDGINYVLTKKDLRSTLKRVHNHLEVKGLFIFDVSSEYKVSSVLGDNTFSHRGEELSYIWENSYSRKILNMDISFYVKEEAGYSRIEEVQSQRAYSKGELVKELEALGFKVLKVYGGFDFSIPKTTSHRIHFITRKEG